MLVAFSPTLSSCLHWTWWWRGRGARTRWYGRLPSISEPRPLGQRALLPCPLTQLPSPIFCLYQSHVCHYLLSTQPLTLETQFCLMRYVAGVAAYAWLCVTAGTVAELKMHSVLQLLKLVLLNGLKEAPTQGPPANAGTYASDVCVHAHSPVL